MATEAATDLHTHVPAAPETPEPHAEPNYIAVFLYLAILTAAELGVYALNFPSVLKIGLLVALALAKATLVAMYFMHLAVERRGLWVVAAAPLMLVAFCYLMLRPDLSARAWAHVPANQAVGVHEGAAPPPAQSESAPANAAPGTQGS